MSDWFPIQSKDRDHGIESAMMAAKIGDINRDWFPYAIAAAAAAVIASGLWIYSLWFGACGGC
jgi:Na+/H+ antiporter NhaC